MSDLRDITIRELDDLVTSCRILVNESVLDVFGHVAVRDPKDHDNFWLSTAKPPSVVHRDTLLKFGADGEPVSSTSEPLFSERYIHSEIFRRRPDVFAICHHHAVSIMPFCVSDTRLAALSQTGAFLGQSVPLWDSQHEFGDTSMLVNNTKQGASLAEALGEGSTVLMRGHGMVVVGTGLKDLVFRTVHACREAEIYQAVAALGSVSPLTAGEILAAGKPAPTAVERGWSHWVAMLPHPPGGSQSTNNFAGAPE